MNLEVPVFKFALREDLLDTGDLFLPTKAEPHATGWDVRAAFPDRKDVILRAGQYFKIPLGFRGLCPEGWYYQLHPRSSSFAKKQIHSLIGIIDFSWEGETLWSSQYLPDIGSLCKDLVIKFGDPIAQIVPVKKYDAVMEKTSNQELNVLFEKRGCDRKDGGFGSTDKR